MSNATTANMTSRKTFLSTVESPAPRQGLRERSKLDKINRIRKSALQLFESKGYEATTTREIADLAEVAIGTVFLYANDKRDLLFLLFNDRLDQLVDGAFSDIDVALPLSDQVHQAFSHLYGAFHQRAVLARLLLKELVFFSEGKQVGQFMENRRRLMAGLEALIRASIAQGSIRSDEDPALIADAFFFLYSGEVRLWLSAEHPDLKAGLARLKRTFALMAHGLGETIPLKAVKPKRSRSKRKPQVA
jgi:AcrR family transcriptional regulator